jgi:hypothetical protein
MIDFYKSLRFEWPRGFGEQTSFVLNWRTAAMRVPTASISRAAPQKAVRSALSEAGSAELGIATKKSCRTFGSRLRYGLSIISDGQPQGVGPYLSPVPAHSLYENRTVSEM